jgi:putative hydrolase of the HAD superfamily
VQGNAHSPDWQAIETVLLDMDGTLLDLGFDNRFWEDFLPRRYAESRGISLDDARRLMRPLFEGTKGSLDWYCIDYWSRALSLDIASLKRSVRQQIAWLPESRGFLAKLRASGRRTVLVTNAHPDVLAIKDAQLGIRRHFDAVYTCFTFGAPKESADFWPRLADRERFDAQRTLFADDSLAVLRAAREHGIEWLYAVGKVTEFPSVRSVHELAAGLVPLAHPIQPAGP